MTSVTRALCAESIRRGRIAVKIGCMILASGQGRRFGSNKLLADLCGQPLLTHTLKHLPAGVFFKTLVVTRWPQVARLCADQGVACLLHDREDRSDVIRLGIRYMEGMDGCLICQGDQPLCRPESLTRLTEAFRRQPRCIHRLAWQGVGASPVLFGAEHFAALASLPPRTGGSAVLKAAPQLVCLTEAEDPLELWDADTPEALERIARALQSQSLP